MRPFVLVLAVLSLSLCADGWSQPRAPSTGACPRRRPSEGSACRGPERACAYACSREDEHDWRCVCAASPDGRRRWRCASLGVCEL